MSIQNILPCIFLKSQYLHYGFYLFSNHVVKIMDLLAMIDASETPYDAFLPGTLCPS